MMKKETLIKYYIKWKTFLDKFVYIVQPFMLIIAFTISLPLLKSTGIAWFFAFVILLMVCNIMFTQLEQAFKKDTSIELLLNINKDKIKELERDIKRLERINLRREELKLATPKKKKSLISNIIIAIIIIIIASVLIYFELKGGLK
jgi:hypothetical protein